MIFGLLKPAATLLLFITICLKYEFGRSATFKKQAKTLNKKALAAIAEDCLSLRSKRVPQELQVPAYLLLLPFIFCWSETFLVRSLVTKNEHE